MRSRPGTWNSSTALDQLLSAHGSMFGYPDDIESLEDRLSHYLLKAADRADAHEVVAAEGGTVARVREDLDPRLAERLGIDTSRPLTQGELAHLLAGARADGLAIEGKQVQKPMKSVAEVFGLTDRQMPTAEEIDHVIAGRRGDGEAPKRRSCVHGCPPAFPDGLWVAGGCRADGGACREHEGWQDAPRTGSWTPGMCCGRSGATKAPIGYIDMIWSADKSVTVAWALAPTEAERAMISAGPSGRRCCGHGLRRITAGETRKGKGGQDGVEKGVTAWVACDHYTSRPTAEVAHDRQGWPGIHRVPDHPHEGRRPSTSHACLMAELGPDRERADRRDGSG